MFNQFILNKCINPKRWRNINNLNKIYKDSKKKLNVEKKIRKGYR